MIVAAERGVYGYEVLRLNVADSSCDMFMTFLHDTGLPTNKSEKSYLKVSSQKHKPGGFFLLCHTYGVLRLWPKSSCDWQRSRAGSMFPIRFSVRGRGLYDGVREGCSAL
jgi:hypothetical protein